MEEIRLTDPFSFKNQKVKSSYILKRINFLTKYHYKNCSEYKSYINIFKKNIFARNYEEIPFLPIRFFKDFNLSSINNSELYRVVKSSGTSGRQSVINLDKTTSQHQSKALIEIVSDFIGKKRKPMVILDNYETIKNPSNYSARSAAIIGFSIFANERLFSLNNNFEFDLDSFEKFIKKHNYEILVFGFTSFIWNYFLKVYEKKKRKLDLSKSIIIHGGGWKKLQALNITNQVFKNSLKSQFNISNIHDYYGLAEQTGTIYFQCKYGRMHISNNSEIIVRDTENLNILENGEIGLLQLISTLPKSYPGHSILTEDLGSVSFSECECGRIGNIVKFHGRLKQAPTRGCSDNYGN